MAKKKARKLTPLMKLVCVAIIVFSVFLVLSVGDEVQTMFQLRKQLSEVEERLQEVQDENYFLTTEKEKLQDPDYIANYARGTYMLSKEGEQIFYLPGGE